MSELLFIEENQRVPVRFSKTSIHTKLGASSSAMILNNHFHFTVVVANVSDEEMQEHYDNFFEDVFVECEDKYGEIEEMNVCDNLGDHLVGNVYIKVHINFVIVMVSTNQYKTVTFYQLSKRSLSMGASMTYIDVIS